METTTATVPRVPVTLPATSATIAELEFPTPAAAEAFLDYIPLGRRFGTTDGTTVLIRFSTHRVYELDAAARTHGGGALVATGAARKAA